MYYFIINSGIGFIIAPIGFLWAFFMFHRIWKAMKGEVNANIFPGIPVEGRPVSRGFKIFFLFAITVVAVMTALSLGFIVYGVATHK